MDGLKITQIRKHMILSITPILLFICLLILMSLAIYPVLAVVRSFVSQRENKKSVDFEVPVSIVICCYNEAEHIEAKIKSLINEKEWIPGSELLVVSGGSTDGTNEILEQYREHEKVKLFLFPNQLTKIEGLNHVIPKCQNEILVFSDCRQNMKPGSIRELVQNFNDPDIGTVNSTLIDSNDNPKPSHIRSLLNYIALTESKTTSSLNIYGALFAQRKSLSRNFPNDILFDDLYIVVSTLNQKMRLVQDSKAIIYDVNFKHYYQRERSERLARGLLLFLSRHSAMIWKMPKLTMMRFLLFKYGKLLVPFLLILIFSCIFLLFLWSSSPLTIGITGFTLIIAFALALFHPAIKQLIKINFHFLQATLLFVFKKKRTILWEKLNTEQA